MSNHFGPLEHQICFLPQGCVLLGCAFFLFVICSDLSHMSVTSVPLLVCIHITFSSTNIGSSSFCFRTFGSNCFRWTSDPIMWRQCSSSTSSAFATSILAGIITLLHISTFPLALLFPVVSIMLLCSIQLQLYVGYFRLSSIVFPPNLSSFFTITCRVTYCCASLQCSCSVTFSSFASTATGGFLWPHFASWTPQFLNLLEHLWAIAHWTFL